MLSNTFINKSLQICDRSSVVPMKKDHDMEISALVAAARACTG